MQRLEMNLIIKKVTASEGIVAKDIIINGNSINYVDLTEKQFYVNYFFKDSDPMGLLIFKLVFQILQVIKAKS